MDAIDKVARLFKAVSDPGRIRVLCELRAGERNVGEIAELLYEDISIISHRLRLLHSERLVKKRRSGQHVFYSLSDEHVSELLLNAINHSLECHHREDD